MEPNEWGPYEYLNHGRAFDDKFFTLPEEIQEQVNAHQAEFRSHEDIRRYVRRLVLRS